MTERQSKLRLGMFAAGGLAGTAGLALLFGGSANPFDGRNNYTITFAEAPNIAPGTPVRKSGVRIGEVTGLDLDDASGSVKVKIALDRKYSVRTTEDATIFRGILSGDTSIDFIPKTKRDNVPVEAGDLYPVNAEIAGITPLNPSRLAQQASGLLPNAQENIARLMVTLDKFEKTLPKIERAFDEIGGLASDGRQMVPEIRKTNQKLQEVLSLGAGPDDLQPNVKNAIADLREFLKTAKPLVEDVRRIVNANEADITAAIKNLRQTTEAVNEVLNPDNRKAFGGLVKNLNTASDDLTKAIRLAAIVLDQGDRTLKLVNDRLAQAEGVMKNIESATKPIAENADPILKNAAVAADQLAKTLAELRGVLATVNRGDGAVQKLLADPALYHNLNDAAVSLSRTLLRTERIAADLQVFADKIARRPESLGAGGVVRPNSGLKEAPAAGTVAPIPPNK